MRRVAFLTSGGDCQALNATMRGVAKTLYNADPDTQIIGILEGYKGLMYEKYVEMKPLDFSGILTEGIPATKRLTITTVTRLSTPSWFRKS